VNTKGEQLLESAELRVCFRWTDDRYAHEIWLLDGAQWICALASIEGSPQDDWPASPPLQSLAVDTRDDGTAVALLVGMAGSSHWSASVQLDPAVSCVRFDVACRVRASHAGPLGSTYRPMADQLPTDAIAIETDPSFTPAQLERQDGLMRIVVAAAPDDAPRTIRWGYRLRLADHRQQSTPKQS